MQSNAIQEDIQSKDFDRPHVFEPNDRNTELVALLQPHVSFPVETHNVMDGVQSLIDQIALLRCDVAAAQKKQGELKRVIENDDVPKHKFAVNDRVEVWRENVKLWCEGHISHVNSGGTYHVFYSNGFSDTQVVENLIKRRVDFATVYDHLIEEATKLLERKVVSDSDSNNSLIAKTFKWDKSTPRTVLPVQEPTAANRNSTESRHFCFC